MKIKFVITALALVIISTECLAQEVNVGIKAGTDIHKINGKSFDEEYNFGYHAGAFVTIKFGKIGIQPEVYFSQVNATKGSDSSSVFNINNIKEAKLSYLNIPLLLNLGFSKNVTIQLGPQYSILFNESSSALTNGQNAFKKGDFSLVGGLQVKVSKFRIYGRYVVGLSDINDFDNREKWKNQTIHVGLGYAIF